MPRGKTHRGSYHSLDGERKGWGREKNGRKDRARWGT